MPQRKFWSKSRLSGSAGGCPTGTGADADGSALAAKAARALGRRPPDGHKPMEWTHA